MTNENELALSEGPILLSDDDIDLIIDSLSRDELANLLRVYNNQILTLHEISNRWKFMACCDDMTTSRLNNNTKSFSDCKTKIYTRSYWEKIYKPTHKVLEADCYLIDLINLKFVNDNFGHAEGGNLICDCASDISQFGTVFRLGGDEFFLIVDEGLEDAFKLYLSTNEPNLQFAYGYFHKKPEDSFSSVLKHTDNRMYTHKRKMKSENLSPAAVYGERS